MTDRMKLIYVAMCVVKNKKMWLEWFNSSGAPFYEGKLMNVKELRRFKNKMVALENAYDRVK